jgi:hypothetical protein
MYEVHPKSNWKMWLKREWIQLGGYFLEFLKAFIADLIILLFSSIQNSEGGGDSDNGVSFADPCQFLTTRNPQKTLFKFLAGVSKTIAAITVTTTWRILYWWRQQCKQISNGRLEIFKKTITLLTVSVLFLFKFFNLLLDAPHTFWTTSSLQ